MNTINTGGPAFPVDASDRSKGMTLRDYFAIHATDDDIKCQIAAICELQIKNYGTGVLPDGWRPMARYMHADAMLRARGLEGGAA